MQIALQVREYLTKGVIQNAVNVPSISEEEYQQMLPYIALGERLGTFLAQSCEGGVEEIGLSLQRRDRRVEDGAHPQRCRGRRAQPACSCARAGEPGECGFRCRRARHSPHRTQEAARRRHRRANVLRMTFKSGQQENTVAGCVQPGGQPRLLEIDGIHVEAPLEGNVIYLRNLDVPGCCGPRRDGAGTAQRQHRQLLAGPRSGQETSAVAVVQVDGEITDKVLEALRGIETVLLAKAIRFERDRRRKWQSPSRRSKPRMADSRGALGSRL